MKKQYSKAWLVLSKIRLFDAYQIFSTEPYSIPINLAVLDAAVSQISAGFFKKVQKANPSLTITGDLTARATADIWYKFSQSGPSYKALIPERFFVGRTPEPLQASANGHAAEDFTGASAGATL